MLVLFSFVLRVRIQAPPLSCVVLFYRRLIVSPSSSILSDYLSGILRGNLFTWSSSVFCKVNYPLVSYLTFSCVCHVGTEPKALNPKIIKSKGRILFSIRNEHARLKACDWKAGRIIKELIPRVLHSSGSIPIGASGGGS